MKDRLLKDVPGDKLEESCKFNNRDKVIEDFNEYLKSFLLVARQYGYATRDDSWGELEKELAIGFRRLERYRRFMLSQIKKELDAGNKKPIDEIEDDLLNQGEEFWNEVQRKKKFLLRVGEEISEMSKLVSLFS